MTPAALLVELARRAVKLSLNGDRLRYEAPRGGLTPELLEAMREHKAALVDLLSWPPECWRAEALYHCPAVLNAPHARLFPLVGRRVLTQQGPGRFLAARLDGCPVALDSDPTRAVMVDWQEVRPA